MWASSQRFLHFYLVILHLFGVRLSIIPHLYDKIYEIYELFMKYCRIDLRQQDMNWDYSLDYLLKSFCIFWIYNKLAGLHLSQHSSKMS